MNVTDTTGSEAGEVVPGARVGWPARADGRGSGGVAPGEGTALAKAATLIEALPWLERLHGETVVIKFGGHAMANEALCFAFAQDVVFLRYAGLRPARRSASTSAGWASPPRSPRGCGSPRRRRWTWSGWF